MTIRLIFCLLLEFSILQCPAFLFDKVGVVRPVNPYSFIGDVLNLTCNVTNNGKYPGSVSEFLYFTKMYGEEERPLPLEYISILDSRSIFLEYPVTSGEDQGPYTCLLNRTSEDDKVVNSQTVTVEHRPRNITEIDPVVDDWKSMTVTWDLGQDYINPDLLRVQLSWTVNPHLPTMYGCPHNTTTSCSWRENDDTDSFKMMTYHIHIRVVTFRRQGKDEVETGRADSEFVVEPRLFVKPAPVQDLTVVDRNSTCISFSWTHSQNSQLRTIRHTVLVTHESQLQQNRSTQDSNITICDLNPDTVYTFNVSCIPIPHGEQEPTGYNSEWRDTEETTMQDVPSGAPKMAPGSFRFHSCVDPMCIVTTYWQPVAEDERNGKITKYRLRLIEDTTDGHQKNKSYEINGSERSFDFRVKKDRGYRVEVTAATVIGYSKMSAVINIPPQQTKPAYPYSFVVEGKGHHLYISWDPFLEATPTGYTLYYCNGSTITFKCRVDDDIQWMHIPANQTSTVLETADGILDNKLIGISVERELPNEHITSGITWSECTYVRDQEPAELDNVGFAPGQLERALRIEWESPGCTGETPYILYYVISYCKSSHSKCTGPTVEQNISNAVQSYVIKDLTVGVTYGATVRAVSWAGEGPESVRLFKEVVQNGLSTAETGGIIAGAVFFFLLVLACGVFIIRRVHKKVKHMKIPIKVPRECTQFDEPPELPQYRPHTKSENNNNEKTQKAIPPEERQNTGGEDETDSNTWTTDSDGGHERTPDIPTAEPNADCTSSSTSSSTNGSATSTTALISETRPKQKAPNLSVTLPTIGSSTTENASSGYKTLSEVMSTDVSETGSTDASYSKVTTGYSPSPVSSPGGYVSDSSQTQLIMETPSPTDDKQLQQKFVSLPDIQEETLPKHPNQKEGSVQNSDYVTQYGQDISAGSSTAASYSKVAAGSGSISEGYVFDSNQGYLKQETTSLPTESKAVHLNYVTLPNIQQEKVPKDLQHVQNDDYVRYSQ